MNASRVSLVALMLGLAPLPWLSQESHPVDADGGLVTLFARDDLLSSFSFRNGVAGGTVEQGEIRLTEAQIAYDVFSAGRISYGFVRDEPVELLDLGEVSVPPQSRARDRVLEFPISLFHTLATTGTAFQYMGPGGDVHPFEDADRILRSPLREGLRHVEAVAGHLYLLRVRREGVGSRDELYKFEVVDHQPGHSLTLRWARVPQR